MNLSTIFLFAISLTTGVARELCFKIGAGKATGNNIGYFVSIFKTPLIWLGFLFWAIEIIVWVIILGRVPLNVAFPIMSLSYCGALIAGKFILHEEVSIKKWCGVMLISIGVVIIGSSGAEL